MEILNFDYPLTNEDETDEHFVENSLNTATILYGHNYPKLESVLSTKKIIIKRRHVQDISHILNNVNAVILFHNFIEYSHGMSEIIDTCIEYKVPIFIFSGHVNGCLTNFKSGILNDIVVAKNFTSSISRLPSSTSRQFRAEIQYIPYIKPKKELSNVLASVRRRYADLTIFRNEKQIIRI